MQDNFKGAEFYSAPEDTEFFVGKTYVLAIAINDYPGRELYNCIRDVREFCTVLVEHYDVKPENIVYLLDREATKAAILKELSHFVKKASKHDNFILYFSGHGIINEITEKGYWITSGVSHDDLVDGLPNAELLDYIGKMHARHVLLIVDSCFAGTLFVERDRGASMKPHLAERYKSRFAITSGRLETVSDGKKDGHSPFAEKLLKCLREHPEEKLFARDLGMFVINAVGRNHKQEPDARPLHSVGDEGGQFAFYRFVLGDEAAWGRALNTNTVASFEEYLAHPAYTLYRAEAQKRIDTLKAAAEVRHLADEAAWQQALKTNTIASFEEYLAHPAYTLYRVEAQKRIDMLRRLADEAAWQRALNTNTIASFEEYLANPAHTLHRAEAQKRIDALKKTVELPEMVFVEGGKFQMGSREDQYASPVHEVVVKPFWIGKYAVTLEEYDKFCAASSRKRPDDLNWGRGKRPAINISWEEAQAYCRWISQETGKTCRLPSEAEWEYAARGGHLSKGYEYAGGDSPKQVAWFLDNAHGKTEVVGGKTANELGIFDMSGNVWEWCEDDWHNNYINAPTDGSSRLGKNRSVYRVYRGGCWNSDAKKCRATYRASNAPVYRADDLGFRLVVSIDVL